MKQLKTLIRQRKDLFLKKEMIRAEINAHRRRLYNKHAKVLRALKSLIEALDIKINEIAEK